MAKSSNKENNNILGLLELNKESDFVKFFEKADDYYYVHDESITINKILITDAVYDFIKDHFFEVYPNNEYIKNKVGATPKKQNGLKKVEHQITMGSLLKVSNYEDFETWWKKYGEQLPVIWSEKVDGISVSLNYVNGEYVQAITRGDNKIGEDITANIAKSNLKKRIKNTRSLTFRGEILVKTLAFKIHFKDKASARNTAGGLTKRLDGVGAEHLTILIYDVIGEEFKTLEDKLLFIESQGFDTPKWGKVKTAKDVLAVWTRYEDKDRKNSDYEMDGLVVAIDDLNLQKKHGYVNSRPKFARAFKFTSQDAITNSVGYKIQVGRTGRLTPVAEVDPVFIAGATITSISLHNFSEIKRLGFKIGQKIRIRRSGDVIPQIMEVLDPENGTEIPIPKKCPACSEKTEIEDIFIKCVNPACPAKNYGTLLHWVSVLDIKGFGDELVHQLFDKGIIKEPADFYQLKMEDISELERRGEKSAKKVLAEVQLKREMTLPIFIKGLGIDGVGSTITESAMQKFDSLTKLRKIKTKDELIDIHGLGDISAQNLIDGLKEKADIIDNLLNYVSIKRPAAPTVGILTGKSFCFTGFRNKDLEAKIQNLGGAIANGVTKSLTYLVAEDKNSSSSKVKKAKDQGIVVLEVDELEKLLS
jgi:DNA ligase (NAD+)